MGTRGLVGYQHNNVIKGYYNQYDCYWKGLGKDVLEFTKDLVNSKTLNSFKDKFLAVEWVTQDTPPTPELQEKYAKFADKSVSTKSLEEWYCLLRHLQGIGALKAINNDELSHVLDQSDFIEDSLYCENAYVFNFDKDCLDIYEGYQHIPRTPTPDDNRNYSYGPCKCIASIKFDEISIVKDLEEYLILVGAIKKEEE